MTIVNERRSYHLFFILAVFLLVGWMSLLAPDSVHAAGGDITISGEGLNNPEGVIITQEQLRGEEPLDDSYYLEQQDVVYSTINTWPTKSWYRGQGVLLEELLEVAGGLNGEAAQIAFIGRDGFRATFTLQEILGETRYVFPDFMDTGLAGHLIGDTSGAEEVPTIIAHQSFYVQDLEDISNDDYFSQGDANHLLYGQRAVTQQTNARFSKYVAGIEVLTDPAPQWDAPTASVDPGEVPVGTLVELESEFNDEDKVHYTLDGTDPTIESQIYNYIASRWWSQRADQLKEINRPIEITEDTTIRAFVTGPGREDSEIAEFVYTVEVPPTVAAPVLTADSTDNMVGQEIDISFTDDVDWRGAITGVGVDDTVLSVGEYTITAGNINLSKDLFAVGGYYRIVVRAEGYSDSSVIQTIMDPSLLASPVLIEDSTRNTVGQEIDISFTDDVDWREAITSIEVDDSELSSGEYTITAGNLRLSGNLFTAAGEYLVVVQATGYTNATVTQSITGDNVVKPPDGDIVLTISGDGIVKTVEYTQSQLKEMPQHQEVYSSINTWPSKSWYVGEGVILRDLLEEAGMRGNARQIKFISKDGYYMTLTFRELFDDSRYCFPNFKTDGDADGHVPGDTSGQTEVEAILALVSAGGTDNPAYMNDRDALLLMLGQREVTEQTGPLFTKYVNEIEILTDLPDVWDEPTAEPDGGTVPAGTKVELHGPGDDMDKVYYTLDGTTPGLDSPMYNWVAKRWWSSRGEDTVGKINKPIVLTEDTVIKAVTIGPGKLNSGVVEFTYEVTGKAGSASGLITPDEDARVSLEDEAIIDIPAGAIPGTSPVEVMIERVGEPPAAPVGFRIVGTVYEFSIDGEPNYSFDKMITITLRFDPKEIGPDETPVIYYYDEKEKRWVDLGGEVSGDSISVQVNHFTKFAIMVTEAVLELPAAKANLTDISGHWAEDNIKALVTAGTVSGYPDGTFKPDNNITRAEFTSMLVKAFALETQKGYGFSDTVGHWAEEAISTAVYHGIVGGLGGNRFGPNDTITREQMAVMIVNAAKLPPVIEATLFNDSGDISYWANVALATAVKNGIINGYPDSTVRPQAIVTRAEAVTVIVDVLSLPGAQTKPTA